MITALAFTLYPVQDLPAARKFYEETLRLKLSHEFGGAWFEYDLGEATFAICTADEQHPTPVRGAVVAFEVDDLNAEVSRLKGLNILTGGVVDTPVCQFVSLRDPDGNEVLLHQRKQGV